MTICTILTGLLLFQITALAETSAKDVIKNVKKTYKQLKTIQFEFDQKTDWKLAGTSNIISGKMSIKNDIMFRVEMPDLITVSDGKTIWNYAKSTNQVIINRARKSDAKQLPSKLLLQYTEKYNSTLLGEQKLKNVPCYVLNLTSKTGDDYIQKMKVWVDKKTWYTKQIEQLDIHGNLKTFLITSISTNIKLKDSIFTFAKPKTAEVIDMRLKK